MINDANLHALDFDLEKFAKKLDIAPKVVVVRITLDLFRRITKRTPIDTGRARSSWDVKQGSPSTFTPPGKVGTAGKMAWEDLGTGLDGGSLGKGAAQGGTVQDISGEVAEIDGKQVVFITTTIDYMEYLEKGSSLQAPAGMVLLSISEIEIELENILSQL